MVNYAFCLIKLYTNQWGWYPHWFNFKTIDRTGLKTLPLGVSVVEVWIGYYGAPRIFVFVTGSTCRLAGAYVDGNQFKVFGVSEHRRERRPTSCRIRWKRGKNLREFSAQFARARQPGNSMNILSVVFRDGVYRKKRYSRAIVAGFIAKTDKSKRLLGSVFTRAAVQDAHFATRFDSGDGATGRLSGKTNRRHVRIRDPNNPHAIISNKRATRSKCLCVRNHGFLWSPFPFFCFFVHSIHMVNGRCCFGMLRDRLRSRLNNDSGDGS